ncbi:hypothetical protein KI387_037180, partial [Taxus chinensis]
NGRSRSGRTDSVTKSCILRPRASETETSWVTEASVGFTEELSNPTPNKLL